MNFPKNRGDPTTFKIYCPNIRKTLEAVCNFYCPIRLHDSIYALCEIKSDNKFYILRPPFVQPSIDKGSIIQSFVRILRIGIIQCGNIFDIMSNISGGDDQVIAFLTGLAQLWNDTNNINILSMFNGIDSVKIKKILNWWYKDRNLRRLYLLGLNDKEINECKMTCDEIYQKCIGD